MSRPCSFCIRPIDLSDKPWIEELLESSWGGIEIVSLTGLDGIPLRDEIELEMLL